MNQKLTALALVAITALSVIRHDGDRHVPGTKNETFEADPETADRLVESGAAKYAVDAADQTASAELALADKEAADRAVADKAAAGPAGADQAAAAAKTAPAKTAPAKTATKKR